MTQLFNELETNYLDISQKYLDRLFGKKHIPSHDQSHHIRVWKHAREFIPMIQGKCSLTDEELTSVFFACLFHDCGLTVSPGKNHGKESRILFEKFASTCLHIDDRPKEMSSRLIEDHDNKERIAGLAKNPGDICNPLLILSVCDDLDAFGAIGVLRFCEIYMMREIQEKDVPAQVIRNLDFRMTTLQKTKSLSEDFFRKHEERALMTLDFFRKAEDIESAERKFISLIHKKILVEKMGYFAFNKICTIENLWPSADFGSAFSRELEIDTKQD